MNSKEGYARRFLEWLERTPAGATEADIRLQYPGVLPFLGRLAENHAVFLWNGRWYRTTRREPLDIPGPLNRPNPDCTQATPDGSVYHCSDLACPVHGDRNRMTVRV